jgi:hypothetical protein
MNRRGHATIALATIASIALTACGSEVRTAVATSTPVPIAAPTTIDGNWSLAGARNPAHYPILSTTLHVTGNQITGSGSFSVQCPSPRFGGIGGSLSLSGQIGSDGTFQMNTPALDSIHVTLSGNSPKQGAPGVWTGTYTGCDAPRSGVEKPVILLVGEGDDGEAKLAEE